MDEHKKNFQTEVSSRKAADSPPGCSRTQNKRRFAGCIRIFLILLTVYAVYSPVISKYKKKFGRNISSFICMGTAFMKPHEMPEGMFYFEDSMGYDGQFFYFIANDPFIRGDMHKYIDVPSYRYQRIMYPLLVHIASAGNIKYMPQMLVSINLWAIMAGTFFIILMLIRRKLNPWYALFYPLSCGLLLNLLRDLAGPVTMAFTVGGFYFYSIRKYPLAMLFISAATLSREIMVAVVPVMIFDSLVIRRQPKTALLSAAPLIPFAIWQWYIFSKFRVPSWSGGSGNFGRPMTAMASHVREILTTPGKTFDERSVLVLFVIVTAAGLVLAIREIIRSRNAISICFLGYSIMPFVTTHTIWIEPWSYGRVFLPSAVFMLLSFIQSKDRIYLLPLSLYAALFPVTLKWLNII